MYNIKWNEPEHDFTIEQGMILLIKNNQDSTEKIELVGARYSLPEKHSIVAYNDGISNQVDFNKKLEYHTLDTDYIDVSWVLKVNLKNVGEVREIYHRKRDTTCFDLDEIARYICFYEKRYGFVSTSIVELLEDLEKQGFKSNSEKTIQELFDMYWVKDNFKKVVEQEFNELNSGNKDIIVKSEDDEDYSFEDFYAVENNYLKLLLEQKINHFNSDVLPVKQGFLYFIWKYIMNENIDELIKDFNNTPKLVKNYIDSFIKNKE